MSKRRSRSRRRRISRQRQRQTSRLRTTSRSSSTDSSATTHRQQDITTPQIEQATSQRQPKQKKSNCKSGSHVVRIPLDGRIVKPQGSFKDDVGWRTLETVKDFAQSKNGLQKKRLLKKDTRPYWQEYLEKDSQAEKLKNLFTKAAEIMRQEPRCISVGTPCYVFGDIHGNLQDLLTYERLLWNKNPLTLSASYLFNGDYVDRGYFGLECVLYLFALKILNPKRFVMLRGNHEDRAVQKHYTFLTECKDKFGAAIGTEIWESCNKAFDCLPLCAIVDDSVFCAHGGIPRSASTLGQVKQIPVPMSQPEKDSQVAWEILWNDPISDEDFLDFIQYLNYRGLTGDRRAGFLKNVRRGTAYYYSDKALDGFLQKNNLSKVIRGHEVFKPGYKIHGCGNVITVFSSSNYCGEKNRAATIFLDKGKMQITVVDTKVS